MTQLKNVSLDEESRVDIKPMLRKRETELNGIIEAIEHISRSNYWKVLQNQVFNGILESLQRRMRNEKETIELFRLQGQIGWAEKYTDFNKLGDAYRNELTNIRKQLNA